MQVLIILLIMAEWLKQLSLRMKNLYGRMLEIYGKILRHTVICNWLT